MSQATALGSASMPIRARWSLQRASRAHSWRRATAAIDRLSRMNRRRPSVELERELVRLRVRAAQQILESTSAPPEQTPTAHDSGPLPSAPGTLPELDRTELTVDTLSRGVRGHGALIVRNMFDEGTTSRLRDAVTATYAAYDAWDSSGGLDPDEPWLHFAPNAAGVRPALRRFGRQSGGVLAFDSPRAAFALTDALIANGIRDLAAAYLQAPPVLTIEKTTLRIIKPELQVDNGWHQDGAFLGPENPALNIWIALTECGDDAPSMKFVPHRLDGVVPTGTDGAAFSWSVSPIEVERALRGADPQTVRFMPGDAIFFDGITLHSTATSPTMTKPRMAIEAWMFGARKPADNRLPLLL